MAAKKPKTIQQDPPITNNKYSDIAETSQAINQRLQSNVPSNSSTRRNSSNFNIFDIIADFDWTNSDINSIYQDIPYILLQEFKIGANSQMASLITNAMLIPDTIKSSTQSLEKAGGSLINKAKQYGKDNSFAKFMDSMAKTSGGISDKLVKSVERGAKTLDSMFSGLDNTTDKWADQTLAQMYKFLYIRKETNRWYKFPYFENRYYSISNSFQDSMGKSSEGIAESLAKGFSEGIENIQKIGNITALTEPGSYVQRPKFYDFSSGESSFNVNFCLFNTINDNAFIRNNIFLQTLIVQNTPHRHNRLLVDPPCIYEVTVPGRGFYPFCFINDITVNYKGVQRVLGSDGGKEIIVPDAFEVSIGITSLTKDVNNFMIPEFYDGMTNLANERGNVIGGYKSSDKSNKNTIKVAKSRNSSSSEF